MTMWIAIFIVPLIYLVNAFFIGKLIKRIKISSNGFFNFVLGFFTLFVILYFLNILLYSLRANIWGYALTYGIFQIILLGSYIFNWKYIFMKPSISWRQILVCLIVIGLIFLIGWLSFREPSSMFGEYWKTSITDIKPSLNNVINFNNNIMVNFSVLNISNVFWANVFKISSAKQIMFFANWSWTLTASIICGCIAAWMIQETNAAGRIVLSAFLLLFIVVVTLAFIESYAIPDAWLLIQILVYILVMLSHKYQGSFKLMSLTILLMSMLGSTANAYFIVASLFIFSVYWAVRNNENSVAYLLCLGWPVIHVISGFIAAEARYFLFIASLVCFVIALIGIIVFVKFGPSRTQIRIAQAISKHSTKIVYTALIIFLAIILVSNLWIFYEKYNFDFKKIDYKNFLTFIYRIIWNIRIDNDMSIAIINSVLYTLFISLLITFIVLRKSKKSKGYWLTKDVSVKLGIVAIILFCNPLVIHIFNIATRDYSMNTTNMNMLLFVPFIVFFLQMTFNVKRYQIDKWNYYWI